MNGKTVTALALLLILIVPVSAYAAPFAVTTNKDIYTLDEKVIIVGVISDDAPEGYAILVKVTGPEGQGCGSQNILPARDNSFVSRPVELDGCGLGQYTVSAHYADQTATSTFAVSNSSQADAGNKMELRLLANIVLRAQDVASGRLQDLIETGYALPEEVAGQYSRGVSETSLSLQAIEFGNAAEAKRHAILAVRDFYQVLEALSDENVSVFQADEQRTTAGDSSVVETYNRLQEYYYRLQELAEKNRVDKEGEFEDAAALLANTRQMIGEGDLEGAEQSIGQVAGLLEAIRADLYGGEEESLSSDTNSTQQDHEVARRLVDAANRFEGDALALLNETGSPDAEAKLQEALSLIANARSSLQAQNYDEARETLSAAYKALNEARKLIGDVDDGEAPTSTSGEGSDDNSGESSQDDDGKDSSGSGNNSGNGNGNDDGGDEKSNEGPGNSGNNTASDQ